LRAVRAINFSYLLAVGSKQCYDYVNASLIYDCVQILPGDEWHLIRVNFASGHLSLDGLVLSERLDRLRRLPWRGKTC
jgi:hypothetical protein